MTGASHPGLFLAFEGVEGSGKTTQAARLAEFLRARDHTVVLAREPGSTPLGERIRSLVLDSGLDVPPRSELFLMLAARAAFVDEVVRPGLAAGHVVIADRFELSTLAYQGAGRGIPIDEITRGNDLATGGLRPDATLLLVLPPDQGALRQAQANKARDRMEREAADFHHRVARGYRDLAGRVDGIIEIDARGDIDAVSASILAALATNFPETFGETRFISRHSPGPYPDPKSLDPQQ